ncbi:MAG: cytochrome c biogenesis CcdA family protein [Ilumatobacteraceae bacterium]
MIAFIEGSFTYSLLLGILAAVNPCGFVLLPAYLVSYLSVADDADATTRVRRSLSVGSSVSAGFLVVFLLVGAISRLFTNWIELNAKYAALVVGLVLIVVGVRMLSGWRPRLWIPVFNGDTRRSRIGGMFMFGMVYAVASIGCTIGLLTTAILGSFSRHGVLSGVFSVVMYGAGMAVFVMALTTSLAFAKTALVRAGRGVMSVVSHVSSGLILITGVYLTWYWYVAITERTDQGGVLQTFGNWQTTIVNNLSDIGAVPITVTSGLVIVAAALITRRRSTNQ